MTTPMSLQTFSSLSNTTVVAIFPNVCLWRRSLCSNLAGIDPEKVYTFSYASTAYVVASDLVSVRLFCKHLSNLQKFFGQIVCRPPWQKIVRTPMYLQFSITVRVSMTLKRQTVQSLSDQKTAHTFCVSQGRGIVERRVWSKWSFPLAWSRGRGVGGLSETGKRSEKYV